MAKSYVAISILLSPSGQDSDSITEFFLPVSVRVQGKQKGGNEKAY
jgi:hypothetical protein